MTDALPPPAAPERPQSATKDGPEPAGEKLGRGTVVDKPSLNCRGIVAKYDPAHEGYIVVTADQSTFHVKPANAGSYSAIAADDVTKEELQTLEKALKSWEGKGSQYDWTTHKWDETEDHPKLQANLNPELARQLLEFAIARSGYGLASRLLTFVPPQSAPYLHLAACSMDPKTVSIVLAKGFAADAKGDEAKWNGNTPLAVLASLCSCEANGLSKCRGHRKEELFTAGDNEAQLEDEYLVAPGSGSLTATLSTSPLGTSIGSTGFNSMGLSRSLGRGTSGPLGFAARCLSPQSATTGPSGEPAAMLSVLGCAEVLLANGASIHAVNASLEPVLFLALKSKNDALALLLLKKGAWYELPEGKGNPLHVAAGCYTLHETRTYLLSKTENADEEDRLAWLNMKDEEGWLPIHYAAEAGDADLVARMVDWDPDLMEAETDDGETPLCVAAHYGHPRTVETLLDLGADPNKKDNRGLEPMDYAGAMGHVRTSMSLHRKLVSLGKLPKQGVKPIAICQNLTGGCETVLPEETSDRDCRRCGAKRYCSVECAKEDWIAGHRVKCPRTKGGRGRSESIASFVA